MVDESIDADSHNGVRWSSTGDADFEVETIERQTVGTSTFHIKPGEDEFLMVGGYGHYQKHAIMCLCQ